MRSVIVAVSLSLAIAGMSGGAVFAQSTTERVTATDGDAAALGLGNASAAPGSVTRGDSPGTALLGPDGSYAVSEVSPPVINVTPGTSAPAPEYLPEPAAETAEIVEPTTTETAAVASATDLDADNIADELEWSLGLDANNADTDGDGVADGDEVSIYLTDPFAWDTDGDGIADGEELFGILTDPLAWDSDGNGLSDGEDAAAISA